MNPHQDQTRPQGRRRRQAGLVFAWLCLSLFGARDTARAQAAGSDFEIRIAGRTLNTTRIDLPTTPTQGVSTGGRVLMIVQFDGPVRPENVRALEGRGATVVQPLPPFAMVVSAPLKTRTALPGSDGVRWVGDYTPELRVHPDIAAMAHSAANTTDEDADESEAAVRPVNVQFARMEADPEKSFRERIARLGGAVIAVQPVGGVLHGRVYLPDSRVREASLLP